MYSTSAVTISTSRKYWTAQQRRVLVACVNQKWMNDLYQPVAVGNTRQRINRYVIIFKTIGAANEFSRLFGYAQTSAAERMTTSFI